MFRSFYSNPLTELIDSVWEKDNLRWEQTSPQKYCRHGFQRTSNKLTSNGSNGATMPEVAKFQSQDGLKEKPQPKPGFPMSTSVTKNRISTFIETNSVQVTIINTASQ